MLLRSSQFSHISPFTFQYPSPTPASSQEFSQYPARAVYSLGGEEKSVQLPKLIISVNRSVFGLRSNVLVSRSFGNARGVIES
ncbi:unnamed protein product [Allacma fusca]|uniref:Uncharacterized protein n=1 Tax=Allacma fusca TaxID=39272 RepID=A0A8J2LM46_9HEXA|nr:unnamed protein product [Allacma fusca]